MEGGWCAACGSRQSAARTLLNMCSQLHGWRAGRFQNVALALAPCSLVLQSCSNFTDGGLVAFEMLLSH
eukprot:4635003-Pyramimonas_sp.AAC.1